MTTKTKIFFQILLISFLLGSCSGLFTFQKRHYRKGFYFHREADQFAKCSNTQTKSNSCNYIKIEQTVLISQVNKSTANQKPIIKPSNNFSEIDHSSSPQNKLFSHQLRKIEKKWKVKNDEDKKTKLANRAKKKSRVYLLIGILLFILCFVGIGDFFPLVFLTSLYFLTLSLINFFRRKKYKRLDYLPPPDDPKSIYEAKARRSKRATLTFLSLSLIFFLGAIFAVPLLVLVPVFLILAWIFASRRRKYEIRLHKNENPDEVQRQSEQEDLVNSKKASRYGWSSFLFLLLGIIALFFALLAFIGFALETTWLFFLIMLIGAIVSFFLMRYASQQGALAKEHGKKVLDKHPNEKYYSARRKALFGKRMGTLSKRGWLISLIFVLSLVLIILASL